MPSSREGGRKIQKKRKNINVEEGIKVEESSRLKDKTKAKVKAKAKAKGNRNVNKMITSEDDGEVRLLIAGP